MMQLLEALSFHKSIMAYAIRYKINADKFDTLAQHYFFLAYQESGLKSQVSADISINTVLSYCSSFFASNNDGMNVVRGYHCDCIADHMIGLRIELNIDQSIVSVFEFKPRPDHQAWSTGQFKTFNALLRNSAINAKVGLMPVQS
jgi:hypothetical protein